MVLQYHLESLDSLRNKLSQFPLGSSFVWSHTGQLMEGFRTFFSLWSGPRSVLLSLGPELRLNAEAQNLGLPQAPSDPFAHSGERAADPA
jgi:hypothetical protein